MTHETLIAELERMKAECAAELPSNLQTPRQTALALLGSDDPPHGVDAALCRRIVDGTLDLNS